jgi:hypothetical protein
VAFVLLLRVGAVASLTRVAVALALVAIAAASVEFVLFDANLKGLNTTLVVPLLLAAYWIGRSIAHGAMALLFLRRALERAIFVPFNPVQRAGRSSQSTTRRSCARYGRSRRRIRKNGWWRMPRRARAGRAGLPLDPSHHDHAAGRVLPKVFPSMPPDKAQPLLQSASPTSS